MFKKLEEVAQKMVMKKGLELKEVFLIKDFNQFLRSTEVIKGGKGESPEEDIWEYYKYPQIKKDLKSLCYRLGWQRGYQGALDVIEEAQNVTPQDLKKHLCIPSEEEVLSLCEIYEGAYEKMRRR